MSTIDQFFLKIDQSLESLYTHTERRQIGYYMLEDSLGLSLTDILLRGKDIEIAEDKLAELSQALQKLSLGTPLQYVLGEADFYGLRLGVAPGVLIPRPETEELVELVLERMKHYPDKSMRVLDLGTGSGCMPIALASHGACVAHIDAIDISPDALTIARANVERHGLSEIITLIEADILSWRIDREGGEGAYHFIVSNPPYIHPREAETMTPSVLEYEPQVALFAPSDRPTLFYEALAEIALTGAALEGEVLAEINPLYATETLSIMTQILEPRLREARLVRDMSGKERFVHLRLR